MSAQQSNAPGDPPAKPGLLLHTCCAWCLLDVLPGFGRDYGRVVAAFFNPNIHPRAEFDKRLKSVRLLCTRLGLELVADGDYGLAPFLAGLYNDRRIDPADRGARCAWCYGLRLGRTAEAAARLGLGGFSTTLLSSPHQLQGELRAAGRCAAERCGVAFDGRELVALHGSGRERAPGGLQLHRQRYCGCVFSEAERGAKGERD